MSNLKLSDLKINESAKILSINFQDKVLKRRILEMGLTKGTIVTISKISPLGDPINVKLRGYELCLRKNELENIEVENI